MSRNHQALPTGELRLKLKAFGGVSTIVVDLGWSMREAVLRISILSGLPPPVAFFHGTDEVFFAMSDTVKQTFEPLMLAQIENGADEDIAGATMSALPLAVVARVAAAGHRGKGKGKREHVPASSSITPLGKGPPIFRVDSSGTGRAAADESTGDVNVLLGHAMLMTKRGGPNLDVARLCLEAKADANLQIHETYDEFPRSAWWQSTVLGHAIQNGSADLCKLLMEKHASVDFVAQEDIEYEYFRSDSCLNVAVRYGHFEICRLLLEGRADINSEFSLGKPTKGAGKQIINKGSGSGTALFQASRWGKSGICRLLVESRADPNIGGYWEKGEFEFEPVARENPNDSVTAGVEPCCQPQWYGWHCYRCGAQW